MYRGYIKDWRRSLEHPLFKKPLIWHFWGYCLKKASYKDVDCFLGGKIVHIKKGSFVFGLKKASKETGLTIQQIRTALKHLKNLQNLTIKTTNKYSIISITNWDTYQDDEEQTNKQINKQPTSNQQATNKQPTTYKNVENVKNVKNINTCSEEHVFVDETEISSTSEVKKCPNKKIISAYNEILGAVLPQCKMTTTTFDKMLRSRWREDKDRQNIDWWIKYFNFIRESDFLMGRTDTEFMASFEWIIRPTNMAKIINGNYHRNGKKQESIEEYAKRHGYE